MVNGKPKTKLELLMKLANVTGKALASELHVDKSLVSRWKNGDRNLYINREQMIKISRFFTDIEDGSYKPIMQQFILQSAMVEHLVPEYEITDDLIHWLMKPISDMDYYILSQHFGIPEVETTHDFYKSYIGNQDRRTAVLDLFKTMLLSDQPRKMYLMIQEDLGWITEDKSFHNEWLNNLKLILLKGHQIIVIHTINREFKELFQEIIEWIPFYMTGQILSYYMSVYDRAVSLQTIFLIENVCAISGYQTGQEPDKRFTSYTNDQNTTKSLQNLFNLIVEKSDPLIMIYNEREIPQIIKGIIQAGLNSDNSYFRSKELFFSSMSETLLESIMDYNQVDENERKRCVDFHYQLNRNFRENVAVFENRHIYDFKNLMRLIKEEETISSHLSLIAGCVIKISQQHFQKHIKDTIERLEKNSNLVIALCNYERNTIELESIELWVKEGYFMAAWSYISDNAMILCLEPMIAKVFAEYFNQRWQSISFFEKDKTAIIEKFNKLLACIPIC